MATILIKNVPEDVLKELKRLKVELGCKTWADLLEQLTTLVKSPLERKDGKKTNEKGLKRLDETPRRGHREMEGAIKLLRRFVGQDDMKTPTPFFDYRFQRSNSCSN